MVDKDAERIEAWNSDTLPVYEPNLKPVVLAASGLGRLGSCEAANHIGYNLELEKTDTLDDSRLTFSKDIDGAIKGAQIIFICVAVGSHRGVAADSDCVKAMARRIMGICTAPKTIVVKSTCAPGTLMEVNSILRMGKVTSPHDVLYNPEFLAQGSAVHNLLFPDRVVIGGIESARDKAAAYRLRDIYAKWVPQERILVMDLRSAELTKLASNAMLAQRVSTINALSMACKLGGGHIAQVSRACGLDPRIGDAMLNAGPGFGGR